MHVLVPFDIVPVESLVPQAAFGFSPASERVVRYALETFGGDDDLQVTAIHLSADTINIEENMGAVEIRSLADELGVSVEVSIESVTDITSMSQVKERIRETVQAEDIDTVVIGYAENTFADASFADSTAQKLLEEDSVPVVLVP